MTVREIMGMKEAKPFASKYTGVKCSAPDQLVGLEIETEACGHTQEWYQGKLSRLWEVKTDGSLRGNAFEFISKPATIASVIPELMDFYKITGFTEANYTDRCSVHVHTNVQDMTPGQLATVALTYSVLEDVLFEFVNHYNVTDPGGKYRDTNIYCVPWSQCRMNSEMVSKMFYDIDYTFRNWQKYTALNLIPARTLGTLEWRHLHGSADQEKISRWLNLIGCIMNFAKTHEFEVVMETIKKLNDNSAYQQFYTEVFQDYLPYDAKYETALAAGVINAKYALIGLKTTKPADQAKKRAEKKATVQLYMDDLQPAEPGILRTEDHRVNAATRPTAWAPFFPEAPAVADAPRLRPLEAEVAPAPRAEPAAVWPLRRGFLNRRMVNQQWGVRDAIGRMFNMLGTRVRGATWEAQEPAQYVEGFNDLFWRNAPDANWRPAPPAAVQGGNL